MFCRNCGAEVSTEWAYCPSCGKKLVIPTAGSVKRDSVTIPRNPTLAEAATQWKKQPESRQPKTQSDKLSQELLHENTSGQGKSAVVPSEIKGWNWGAFLLWWIWGLGNNTYISLLTLIPFIGFVMAFVLGVNGSAWAWRNKHWDSIEHFKAVQKQWALGGLILVIVLVGWVLVALSQA